MTDEVVQVAKYEMAWEGPVLRNFVGCGHPVQNTFDFYGRGIVKGECGFPEGHTGPHAVVYYETVNYADAGVPNCSTSSRIFLETS